MSESHAVVDAREEIRDRALDTLETLSGQLKTVKNRVLEHSHARFSEVTGIKQPVVGRMLDSERAGATSVPLGDWLRAWDRAGLLDAALQGFARGLEKWLAAPGTRQRLARDRASERRVRQALKLIAEPLPERGREGTGARIAAAVQKLSHGTAVFQECAREPRLTAGQLAQLLGITREAAERLGDGSDAGEGSRMETSLMLWVLMGTAPEMARALEAAMERALADPKKAREAGGLEAEPEDKPVNELMPERKPSYAPTPKPGM